MFYTNFIQYCTSFNKAPSAVAQELGLSKAAVSNWKNRGTYPTDATLQKIANYFGCTVADLTEAKKPTGTAADELDNELINLLSSLTPGQIANVTAYIQGMLSK